ncbi:DUF3800 domain-containing protein [Pseudonocardia phyllosphaerae]|uniref:DUF3800 domain-containing protein n=1 Tax=Pseudonocardia phyllosphaerae TaxID=3390502 RepID=UPI00397C42FC
MTDAARLHAFVDEAGVRARTPKSSAHFVMSAVIVPDEALPHAAAVLAGLRADLGRKPGDTLHWRNVKTHSQRLRIAQVIGRTDCMTLSSVVVCKPLLPGPALDEDTAYLYTLRYLLERLSWFARDFRRRLDYTLAHIVRFKLATLRAYEAELRADPDCRVAWDWLDPHGGRLDQPGNLEYLQLADAVASATFAAFEEDAFGNTERRYLQEMAGRLYRRGHGNLTSYGLKMHPWSETDYPWVTEL